MAVIKPKGNRVTGTARSDRITFGAGKLWNKALIVNAGNGNDIINFKKSRYRNNLNGQNGNDTIYGGLRNDTITGGKGTDTIYTGSGANTVVINKGDGNDIIYNQGSRLTLKFTQPNVRDQITAFEKRGNDLIVTFTHAKVKGDKRAVSEKVTFKNYYYDDGTIVNGNIYISHRKTVRFSSTMQNWSITGVNGVFRGTARNDMISGSAGNDIIYANAGDDIIYGSDGNDAIYGNDGNDTIDIRNGSGDDVADGGDGDDIIVGGYGNNILNGGNGNDIIYGIAGTNTIYGGNGNDTIYGGDGIDRIFSGTGTNTINGGAGVDYIDITDGTSTVIFDDVTYNYYGNDDTIETVAGFKNSDTLQINTQGGMGICPVQIDSTTRDLYLGAYANSINIRIANYSNTTGNGMIKINDADPIRMADFLANNYMFLYTDGNDVISDLSTGVYYTFDGDDVLTNNIVEAYSGITIYAGNGNDSITGISATNTYIYGEDGDDTITTGTGAIYNGFIYGGNGNDTITANDENVVTHIDGGDGNDIITGGNGMFGGAGNDIITAVRGNTYATTNVTTIQGGTGDDELHVQDTHNSNPILYRFNTAESDGNDVVYDNLVYTRRISFISDNGNSYQYVGNSFYNTIRFAKSGNDLIIKYKDQNSDLYRNSITIKNYMTSGNKNCLVFYDENTSTGYTVQSYIDSHGFEIAGTDGNDIIYGGTGVDDIYGNGGDDFIYAGRGNDKIHPGSGNNTIAFYNRYYFDGSSNNFDASNDGNDIVYTNGGGVDTLDFGQCIAVKYEKSDNDLIIQYNFNYTSPQSTVTLKDFYNSTVNNSTQYIKLLGHDAIQLNPEELTTEAITAHNGSIIYSTDNMSFNDGVDYTAYGGSNTNLITVQSTASGTYYFDGGFGDDIYQIDTLNAKTVIYDSNNAGYVNVYAGKLSQNNVFYDMQVTVENGVVVGCDYNALRVYATGLFDKGVSVLANPNLAGVTNGTPAQSIPVVQDGYSNKLTDISGLAQATAAWIASNKEDGVYSTAAMVSEGGTDATAILALAAAHIDWQNP